MGGMLHVETHKITYRRNGDDANGCDMYVKLSLL